MARFDLAEYRLCRELNRGAALRGLGLMMRVASRLGDGALWYLLLAALPAIYGAPVRGRAAVHRRRYSLRDGGRGARGVGSSGVRRRGVRGQAVSLRLA